MPRHHRYLLGALLLLPLRLLAVDVDVTCNRSELYLGETFVLSVNIHGTANVPEPDLSALTNCTANLVARSPRVQLSFNNGVYERQEEMTYSYDIRPQSPGPFKTGPIKVMYDNGTVLEATGSDVNVLGMDSQTDVLLSVIASKDSVLVDEPFQITFQLRLKRLPDAYFGIDPLHPDEPPHLTIPFLDDQGIKGLKPPNVQEILSQRRVSQQRAPGFAINRYVIEMNPFNMGFPFDPFQQSQPARFMFDRTEEVTNGSPYFVYSLTLDYESAEVGDLTFGPVEFKGKYVTGVDQAGQGQTKSLFAIGPAATVRVVPPPEEGRPTSFIGALATGLTVRATLDTQTCQVGDPLTLTLYIAGMPHPDQAYPPDLTAQSNLWQVFKFYPDTMTADSDTQSCTYTYTVRPTAAGTHEFPSIDVSYFDTGTRSYRTVGTPALPIQVIDNPEVDVAAIMSSQQRTIGGTRSIEISSLTTAPIGALEDTMADSTLPGDKWAWLLVLIGPPAYALVRAGSHLWNTSAHRGRKRARRQALSKARHSLSNIQAGKMPGKLEGLLCDVVRAYLSAVTGTQTSGLTPSDLDALLSSRMVPKDIAHELSDLYQQLFATNFAPTGSTPAELEPSIDCLKRLLARLDPIISSGASA